MSIDVHSFITVNDVHLSKAGLISFLLYLMNVMLSVGCGFRKSLKVLKYKSLLVRLGPKSIKIRFKMNRERSDRSQIEKN